MTDTPQDVSIPAAPEISRIRYELKRRSLTVATTERLTPHMIRITFSGEDLADFQSLGANDHVKIFVPDGKGDLAMRDYTPRAFDPEARQLVIDFAIHEAGPATRWALAAKPGDVLEVGGPRGSRVVGDSVTRLLLIGDETALPAIGRWVEQAKAGTTVTSLVAVPGKDDEQNLTSAADHTALWVHRSDATDAAPLLNAMKTLDITPDTYVWIGAEAMVARALRTYLLEDLGHPKTWLGASGYWIAGKADAHEHFD